MRLSGNDVEVGGVEGVSFQFLLITFFCAVQAGKFEIM